MMRLGRNPASIVAAHLLLSATASAKAQATLTPAWVHEWDFGQDPIPGLIEPPSGDNHVVVDPISGLVHCTVSDEEGLFSRSSELLYTFTSTGIDLTIPQPRILGNVPDAYL